MDREPSIDAHQHVWNPATASYPWLTPAAAPIDREVDFVESLPHLRRSGIDGSILVQAADGLDDTENMLATADRHAEVVGVVAWAPLDRPDEFGRLLERFTADRRVVGIRNLIHDRQDPDWLRQSSVAESLRLLESSELRFDLVGSRPEHLRHALWLSERFPDLDFVIDHLGKPPIASPLTDPWASLLSAASANPRVAVKISGLYAAGDEAAAWTEADLRPWVELAVTEFGADRAMYGGDWPICELAGGYDRMWHALSSLFAELSESERDLVLGGTARSFYRLDPDRLTAADRSHDPEGTIHPMKEDQ